MERLFFAEKGTVCGRDSFLLFTFCRRSLKERLTGYGQYIEDKHHGCNRRLRKFQVDMVAFSDDSV